MGKLVTGEQNNSFIGTIRPRRRHGDKVSLDRLFSDMIRLLENTTIYTCKKFLLITHKSYTCYPRHFIDVMCQCPAVNDDYYDSLMISKYGLEKD